MASNDPVGPELETDVEYISTPAAEPSKFEGPDTGFRTTKVPPPFRPYPACSLRIGASPSPNGPPIELH